MNPPVGYVDHVDKRRRAVRSLKLPQKSKRRRGVRDVGDEEAKEETEDDIEYKKWNLKRKQ
jgi:hypothetical protein